MDVVFVWLIHCLFDYNLMLNKEGNESSSERVKEKSPAKRFLLILGMMMFAVYLVLGLIIIFWDKFPLHLDKSYRVMFGLLLIIYSFFRFVRLVQTRKDH